MQLQLVKLGVMSVGIISATSFQLSSLRGGKPSLNRKDEITCSLCLVLPLLLINVNCPINLASIVRNVLSVSLLSSSNEKINWSPR